MSDYPVTCPIGTTLDEECARLKKLAYEARLNGLARVLAAALNGINDIYVSDIAACNGGADCITTAKDSMIARVQAQLDNYNRQVEQAKKDYEKSLLDCCKQN